MRARIPMVDRKQLGTRAGPPPRVVIENVDPEIDGGRFPIKRTVGERVTVTADIHADGHDELRAVVRHRAEGKEDWNETEMTSLGNDRWRASFPIEGLEPYRYSLEAWIEPFRTWRKGLARKVEAGAAEAVDLLIGAGLLEGAAQRARGGDAKALRAAAAALRDEGADVATRAGIALGAELAELAGRHPDRRQAARYERELRVVVDHERARFSAWYEMFPRSCAPEPGRHGTFADCEKRLEYVASMGFDVLYLPPIHPIGRTHRKGKNNSPAAAPEDVGSPWAIGAEEGGHKSVHPDLGTLEDFRRLVAKARERGIEIALDLAYQCSPDHPWVNEHPEWFRWRPDGRVQYAENPPKKYEDIYPIHFENEKWRELWEELKSVVDFWIEQGVRVFRVDNPHTKPFRFWEWMIGEVKRDRPEVVFLAEAFTRPRVMYQLAKLGFSQSYTYFAWRNTKWELTEYLRELIRTEVREFFRPNLWPNTPDILTEPLQYGGRAAFQARLVLAATLGASYGIYGPAFELGEARARQHGSEEYLDSEKYELRHWDIAREDSLKAFIARVNRIRRENLALRGSDSLRFHSIDNEQLIAYSKASEDLSNVVLVVVNLDPHHVHSGWLEVPIDDLGLDPAQPYQVHDLLTEARYFWSGRRNFVEVDPRTVPAHVFRIRRKLRTERDFDYFL
jgi:starch synthase (maltosyl-transferring)